MKTIAQSALFQSPLSQSPLSLAALVLIFALGAGAAAEAHAKLVRSDPAEGGEAKDKSNIALTFSEAISGKLSGAVVTDAAGRKAASASMLDQGDKGLMVMMAAPLKPGTYKLDWRAVASDDGHRTTGTLHFSVK